jgi:Uncharacterised protein family (UPF0175)
MGIWYDGLRFKEPEMLLTIDLPDDVANQLSMTHEGDLARSTLEMLALAGYMDGTFSRFQVQRMLGFTNRWETEDWLGSRGATMHYTEADLETDRKNLDRLFSGPAQ